MEPQKMTTRQFLLFNKLIFIVMLASQFLFAIFFTYTGFQGETQVPDEEIHKIFIFIVPSILLISFVAGSTIFKKKVTEARKQESLKDKLAIFRQGMLIRYAFLQGSSFLSLIVLFLTGNLIYMVFFGTIIFIFLLFYPSKERIINYLDLSYNEIQILNNPDSLIS